MYSYLQATSNRIDFTDSIENNVNSALKIQCSLYLDTSFGRV